MKMQEPFGGQFRLGNSFNVGAGADQEAAPSNMRNLRISLKQWKMFHAVLDFDGFFGAADSLHLTQSTVSHGVAKLQEQLGISLLELKGRKAQITEEGKILLERSRDLVRHAIELEALAETLRQGLGPEIRLAVDPGFPVDLLMLALKKSSAFSPSVRLNVSEATAEQSRAALRENRVELAISSEAAFGHNGKKLIDIEHVLVAHPDNPLFGLKRPITPAELHSQFQIVVSGSHEPGALALDTRLRQVHQPWRVNSLDRAIDVLRHGAGYTWLPRHQLQTWLDQHQLRIVPFAHGSTHRTPLYLNLGRLLPPEAAAAGFVDALRSCCAQFSYAPENGDLEDHFSTQTR